MIIHPLVQAAIFALVLGQLLSGRLPNMEQNPLAYPIYLLSGTLGWNLFTEVVTRCLTVFIENGNLLKKLVFPKICLPLIVSGSALTNNLLLFGAIIFIFLLLDFTPGIQLLWFPVLTLVNLLLSLGIGVILGVLNVFARDVGQFVPIFLQLLFWFTPIVYTPDILPAPIKEAIKLNPLFWIIKGYQNVILYNTFPPAEIGIVLLIALLLIAFALTLFRRANTEMVDVL